MFFHGLNDLFEFMVLSREVAFGELGEVEVTFAVVHVAGDPPGERLSVGIPGVSGGVAVTIVARVIEEDLDVFGNGILGGYVGGVVATEVLFGAEELDDNENGEKGEEEFAEHGFFKGRNC